MGRRIALVVSALAGDELAAGRTDAGRIHSVLCDEDYGACDPARTRSVQDCPSKIAFQSTLEEVIGGWSSADQLVLYFSGHGRVKHGEYGLVFGEKHAETFLPFGALQAELKSQGVTRAILILDACHSGAALAQGQKSGDVPRPTLQQELPTGIVLLASCRAFQSSYEFDDGSGSVFTHLLIRGIKSGLGGRSTPDDLIGPDDIVEYVNERLGEPEFAKFRQEPVYSVSNAKRQVWLARNCSAEAAKDASGPEVDGARTYDELRHLYRTTAPSSHPCKGCSVDELEWDLVDAFARRTDEPLEGEREEHARQLGRYSAIDDDYLHRAAVLCFTRAPHKHYPQARALFTVGDKASTHFQREDVLGPLPRQVNDLRDQVDRAIKQSHPLTSYTPTQRLFFQVVREAISNAVTHRDYGRNEVVTVNVDFPEVTVFSPGQFPSGATFETLLRANDHLSSPKDAAIAWYMSQLNVFEGLGRGFEIFDSFLRETGDGHLACEESEGLSFITLRARFPVEEKASSTIMRPPERSPAPESSPPAAAPPPPEPSDVQVRPPSGSVDIGPLRERIGRYEVRALLGQGGMSKVYRAHDPELNRDVAVKVLSIRFESPDARARFEREARISASLNHPSIVPIYDAGVEGDLGYYVMKLVEGQSLEGYFEREGGAQTKAAAKDYYSKVLAIVVKVLSALDVAHAAGVVHRDIKPGNILLDEQLGPVLTDFGISSMAGMSSVADMDSSHTVGGTIMGTPTYMSPEQARGESVDHRADLYSLGCVFYELLTGAPPFVGASAMEIVARRRSEDPRDPRRRAPHVPTKLAHACMRALERRPEDRYESAAEMLAALFEAAPSKAARGLFGSFGRWLSGSD